MSLTIDHYTLSQIEKLRRGDNLHIHVNVKFLYYADDEHRSIHESYFTVDHIVAKSKWVEEILPAIGYKNMALIEIPKLKHEKLNTAIDLLDVAWKKYSMGEFDEVLVKCRKVLEEVTSSIKKEGFVKKVKDENGRQRTVPDWDKFLDSTHKGDALKTISQSLFGLVTPGAHTGTLYLSNHFL